MAEAGFILDERLEGSSHLIMRHKSIQIRLVDDARFQWVLLIPELPQASELHELNDMMRRNLLDLASRLGKIMKTGFEADKINVAAIGNIVPQLHVHVVARQQSDDAWPAPIWGFGDPVPMPDKLRRSRISIIQNGLKRDPD